MGTQRHPEIYNCKFQVNCVLDLPCNRGEEKKVILFYEGKVCFKPLGALKNDTGEAFTTK